MLLVRVGEPPPIHRVLVHQDAVRVPVQIIVLAAAGCPEQHADGDQSEDEHAGNEAVDDFHGL